jgi:RecA-family ATPase
MSDAEQIAELERIGTFDTLDLPSLATRPAKSKRFAIERLVPDCEVTLFTGPGSAGKSLLAQQMATCAAQGRPCLGLKTERRIAFYVTCEDNADELHFRQERLCTGLGVNMADLHGVLQLTSLRGKAENALGTFDRHGIYHPSDNHYRLMSTIAENCGYGGAGIVFLDNISHLFTGNENDRGQVTQFLNSLNSIADVFSTPIVLLGHTPKPFKPGAETHATSGSTAWVNAVRSQFGITHDLETDTRTLTLGKANYAAKGGDFRFFWRDWTFAREEEMGTNFAAQLVETGKAQRANEAFLRCLRARGEGREVGPNLGPNYAPNRFADMPEAKGLPKAELAKAMERLLHTGAIVVENVKRKGRDTKSILVEAGKSPADERSE